MNDITQSEKENKKIHYNIKRKLNTSEIMNIWKNTLCVIGNPNKITVCLLRYLNKKKFFLI